MDNKFNFVIVFLSLVVIIMSIASLATNITGRASSIINLTIDSSANINFIVDSVNFGFGSVSDGETNATIDTLGSVTNGNWTPVTEGFVVENIGNSNVSLQLKADRNSSSLFGGTNPGFQYNVTNNESGSCTPGAGFNFGQWYDVNVTGDGTVVCSLLNNKDDQDSIRIDVKLVVPSDSLKGPRQSTFTATGTVI